jgi:hypothetical protein
VVAPFLCVGKYFAGPAVGSFGFGMETSGSWRWPMAARGEAAGNCIGSFNSTIEKNDFPPVVRHGF